MLLLMRIRILSLLVFCCLIMAGRSATAQITATPDPLDFGEVVLTEILDLQLVLENTGTTDVLVNNFYLTTPGNGRESEFEILSPSFRTFVMAAGDKRTIILRFAPDFEGLRTRTLLVQTDQGEFLFDLQGTGKITHPDLRLSTNNINFGKISITGEKQVFIDIQNVGEELAKISDVNVANFSGIEHFKAFAEDKPFPVILAQGESMRLRITFEGAEPIGFKSGKITLVGSVAGQTIIDLAGEVIEADIVITPDPLDFGDVEVGVPVTKSLTLMAIAAGPIEIDYINELVAPFSYVSAPPVPLVLTPGVPFELQITLTAEAPGPIVSQLQLISDDLAGGGFRGVDIRANGRRGVRVASSEDFTFYCGSKKPIKRTANIENRSADPITLASLTTSPGVVVTTSVPLQIPGSSTATIEYEFDPALNSAERELVFEYLDASSVLVRDTVRVTPVTAVMWSPQMQDDVSGAVAVSTSFDFTDFELRELEYHIRIDNPDLVELVKDSITLNQDLLSNASFDLKDIGAGYYQLEIRASQPVEFSPGLPLSEQPIFTYRPRYFVASESYATVHISLTNADACTSVLSDSISLSSTAGACGDEYLLAALRETPIGNIALFPIPVTTPELSVTLDSRLSGPVTITILTLDGQESLRKDVVVALGRNVIKLETTGLANGPHWLVISALAPRFSSQLKFVIER